jgi:hypothetical protein
MSIDASAGSIFLRPGTCVRTDIKILSIRIHAMAHNACLVGEVDAMSRQHREKNAACVTLPNGSTMAQAQQ